MLVVTIVTGAQANPAQFNLNCAGKITDLVKKKTAPWGQKIAVDLTSKQYCVACSREHGQVQAIQDFTATKIVFEDKKGYDRAFGQTLSVFEVNRTNGDIQFVWEMSKLKIFQNAFGTCSAAPFEGFPHTKF